MEFLKLLTTFAVVTLTVSNPITFILMLNDYDSFKSKSSKSKLKTAEIVYALGLLSILYVVSGEVEISFLVTVFLLIPQLVVLFLSASLMKSEENHSKKLEKEREEREQLELEKRHKKREKEKEIFERKINSNGSTPLFECKICKVHKPEEDFTISVEFVCNSCCGELRSR